MSAIRRRRPKKPFQACPGGGLRAAARLYASGGNGAIYYGLGVTEHSQGPPWSWVWPICDGDRNIGREGVGVNPLRGQNNVQGSCDMGSFPTNFRVIDISDDSARGKSSSVWGLASERAGPSNRQHVGRGGRRWVQRALRARRGHRPIRPNTQHITAGLSAMECVIVQDLFLNETGDTRMCSSRLLVPGKGRHLHQRRAADRPGAQGDGAARRLGRLAATIAFANALGVTMNYWHPTDHGRGRASDADLRRRHPREARRVGSIHGRVMSRRRPARRSCMSTISCAARATSC